MLKRLFMFVCIASSLTSAAQLANDPITVDLAPTNTNLDWGWDEYVFIPEIFAKVGHVVLVKTDYDSDQCTCSIVNDDLQISRAFTVKSDDVESCNAYIWSGNCPTVIEDLPFTQTLFNDDEKLEYVQITTDGFCIKDEDGRELQNINVRKYWGDYSYIELSIIVLNSNCFVECSYEYFTEDYQNRERKILYFKIDKNKAASVSAVPVDTKGLGIYGITGRMQKGMQNGINIISTEDGKTVKVLKR